MIGSPAIPQLPINVQAGRGVGVRRKGGAVIVELADIALTTSGAGATYAVSSPSGDLRPTDGLSLLVRIDRPNTVAPMLDLDGTGGRPWNDVTGAPLAPGALSADFLMRTTFDAKRGAWFSDQLAGLTVGVLDAIMRLWLATLPTSPTGIGPSVPWNDGGILSITPPTNPKYDPGSATARIDLLRLVRSDLPTAPDGLASGEPWLNGSVITFVP